ncbi:uncharacterized protein K452DRAFT_290332 [Aplosporella prunicola CBS 121167]|uniref:F-box domain-containing protein n=1 Tax=Aplosporella prunicola CBS 121167 TaxID=1176127 RepID=A0A6A6B7A3_9PEZI|nr:uncharacterized protein K452DRAFT_290332 [Aplosporella prunicola CBS 121167]KAF2138681.1 hypothetical protein K452DRAFT_290332 [Aplosporella prunicola CBS 121167]
MMAQTDQCKDERRFYFLHLPAEIRTMLYRLLVTFSHPLDSCRHRSRPARVVQGLEILRTCKIINIEASYVFFTENTISFTVRNYLCRSFENSGWLARVRHLRIHVVVRNASCSNTVRNIKNFFHHIKQSVTDLRSFDLFIRDAAYSHPDRADTIISALKGLRVHGPVRAAHFRWTGSEEEGNVDDSMALRTMLIVGFAANVTETIIVRVAFPKNGERNFRDIPKYTASSDQPFEKIVAGTGCQILQTIVFTGRGF